MDKQGRLFGKISVIDIFALVIIIGLVCAVAYRFTAGRHIASDAGQVTYTIKINGVRDFSYQYYHIGDLVTDLKTNQEIGRVTGISKADFTEEGLMADGSVVAPVKPGIIFIYIDITAQGSQSDSAIFVNGTYEIKAGSEIHLGTKYIDVTGTVSAVSIK